MSKPVALEKKNILVREISKGLLGVILVCLRNSRVHMTRVESSRGKSGRSLGQKDNKEEDTSKRIL